MCIVSGMDVYATYAVKQSLFWAVENETETLDIHESCLSISLFNYDPMPNFGNLCVAQNKRIDTVEWWLFDELDIHILLNVHHIESILRESFCVAWTRDTKIWDILEMAVFIIAFANICVSRYLSRFLSLSWTRSARSHSRKLIWIIHSRHWYAYSCPDLKTSLLLLISHNYLLIIVVHLVMRMCGAY